MAIYNSHDDHSIRPARLLGQGLGLAAAIALATGGVAAAATAHEASSRSGTSAPAAISAAAPTGSGFLRGSNVKATPRITSGGGIVTVTGEAPLNARTGEWITIVSNAFVSKAKLEGLPAIRTQVLVNGKYSVKATVRGNLKSGNYVIAGRYRGLPFESWTSVSVRPYSTVTVTPRIVSGGTRVTISGEGPKDAPTGQWITLMSDAFASRTQVNGIPAIRAQVGRHLFEPVQHDAATHGIFDEQAKTSSPQLWAATHRPLLGGAILVALTGLASTAAKSDPMSNPGDNGSLGIDAPHVLREYALLADGERGVSSARAETSSGCAFRDGFADEARSDPRRRPHTGRRQHRDLFGDPPREEQRTS